MKETIYDDRCRGRFLLTFIEITSLTLLMLVSIASTAPFAYVTNYESDNISVIDIATKTVTKTLVVGSNPWGIAITPYGTSASSNEYIYVANVGEVHIPGFIPDNTVSITDTKNNIVIKYVTVGRQPYWIAISPDGKKVYVTADWDYTISVIDTSSNTVIKTFEDMSGPKGIAVTPDGKYIYVANFGSYLAPENIVSVIDTATNTVIKKVVVGKNPYGVAVSPDGTKVYVTNQGDNNVSVIDTATNTVMDAAYVGDGPEGVVVSPDGTKVYVTNNLDGTVSIIDTAYNIVTYTVDVGYGPKGIAVTPDGRYVCVANQGSNNVSIIDTDLRYNVKPTATTVNVGKCPTGVAIKSYFLIGHVLPLSPQAIFDAVPDKGKTPLKVHFTDESITGLFGGKIISRNWNFGDGYTSTEQNPEHTYNTLGKYTVSLTIDTTTGMKSIAMKEIHVYEIYPIPKKPPELKEIEPLG